MSLHGGDIYKIYRENQVNVIDYSANINPLGLSKSLKNHLKKSISDLIHYPDPNYIELKNVISKNINISPKNLILGNGATEIIFLFIKALNPKKTLIISPTFAEYERALKNTKSQIDYFQLTETENNFYLDIQNLKNSLDKKYDLVIFCNPNNPTGSFLNSDKFSEILKYTENFNTKFLIDEAFIDFLDNSENLSYKNLNSDKILIIRAFTKFFAIPGLRLGYGICLDDSLLKKSYELKEPWTINTFASSCGKILLEDTKYINKTLKYIKKERNKLIKNLEKNKDLTVFASEVNFLLIKLHNLSGKVLYKKLLKKGFLIRKCENFKFLDDNYIRIAVKNKKFNKKFLKSINKIINKKSPH